MTITIGWWAIPLIITLGAFLHFYRIWVKGSTGIGGAIATAFAVAAALNVSLIAWLAWALCMWSLS